jgi:predicted methyltransferase
VNSYHEFRAFDEMMQGFRNALKPHGVLGIIEPRAAPTEPPGRAFRHHRIAPEVVRDDAARAGLQFVRTELGFVNPDAGVDSDYWFFLIFQKPS